MNGAWCCCIQETIVLPLFIIRFTHASLPNLLVNNKDEQWHVFKSLRLWIGIWAFSKSKLKNCFTCHLNLCIQFYAECFYMIENSPKFEMAINGRTQKHTTMFNLCQLFKADNLFSEIIRFFLIISLF
jgi:hypothetical protein